MSQPNHNKSPKPKANKNPNKFIRFTATGFQMGATIFLGHYLGEWLDAKYEVGFWENTITLIAVFISIYLVISQVTKLSKDDD